MDENLLQKIIELSKELGTKEKENDALKKENEYLEKELESLRPQQSRTQKVLEKRKKMANLRGLF